MHLNANGGRGNHGGPGNNGGHGNHGGPATNGGHGNNGGRGNGGGHGNNGGLSPHRPAPLSERRNVWECSTYMDLKSLRLVAMTTSQCGMH